MAEFPAAKAAWKDGVLSFDEFRSLVRNPDGSPMSLEALKSRFEAMDQDGSGLVSLAEFTQGGSPTKAHVEGGGMRSPNGISKTDSPRNK